MTAEIDKLIGDNSRSLDERLFDAAMRVIAANGLIVVGRDGRERVLLETIDAHGRLADLLREMAGEIPDHNDACAARVSPMALCNCGLQERIASLRARREG